MSIVRLGKCVLVRLRNIVIKERSSYREVNNGVRVSYEGVSRKKVKLERSVRKMSFKNESDGKIWK